MFGRKKHGATQPLTEAAALESVRAFNTRADELDLEQRDQPDTSEMRRIRVRIGRLRDAATLLSQQLNAPKQTISVMRAAIDSGNAALNDPQAE